MGDMAGQNVKAPVYVGLDLESGPDRTVQMYSESWVAAILAEERKKMVARVKALPTTSMCPFEDGRANGLKPEDPCPRCGELGTIDSEPKCDGGFRARVIDAILADDPSPSNATGD